MANFTIDEIFSSKSSSKSGSEESDIPSSSLPPISGPDKDDEEEVTVSVSSGVEDAPKEEAAPAIRPSFVVAKNRPVPTASPIIPQVHNILHPDPDEQAAESSAPAKELNPSRPHLKPHSGGIKTALSRILAEKFQTQPSAGQESGKQVKSLTRELLEVEKIYREGLTSLKDIIAPAAVKVNPNELEITGTFSRTYFVLAYPRFLSSNWLAPIINMDAPMDISMFVYPLESGNILKKLRTKVGQIQSNITLGQERGEVRDPMLETALKDVEELRDRLIQGTERYFRFSLYFTLYSASLDELNKASSTMETILGSKLMIIKRSFLQMRQGFNSTLPLGNDELAVSTNLNTEPLSSTFPFVSSDLTSNEGILYGVNLHNNSLILFDRFSMENANLVVFAKSGAGKSYLVKLEILRSLMVGSSVIVIDPENEYKHLSDSVGGVYLNVSLNSEYRVNPFELPKRIEGEDDEAILRSAIVFLMGLMNILLGKMDSTEEAVMERALWETYAKKDITAEVGISGKEMPVMNDLVEILGGIEGGENLAARLYKFTEGTFSGLFNKGTNVELSNQLVVFSIRDLEDTLRPAAIYIILNYIWNEVRSELKRRILVIDEAWWMMQHEDSAVFLKGMAKRARKYYLGVTTITQDVTDFLQSSHGEPIIQNSSIQILLKQSPAAIDLLTKVFYLTEGEKYLLLESEVGEGLFFAGLKHVAMKVVASYIEDQIITTDPRQLLEIQRAKEELKTE